MLRDGLSTHQHPTSHLTLRVRSLTKAAPAHEALVKQGFGIYHAIHIVQNLSHTITKPGFGTILRKPHAKPKDLYWELFMRP